jgi:undecaprenyl-diphosphatase
MGLVEGLTEFLPVSSTGHLILAGDLLGLHQPSSQVFEVVIQSGAMVAVLWEYRSRFAGLLTSAFTAPRSQRFIVNLVIAFLPAALLGVAFGSFITANLFRPIPVAVAFILGGLVIMWIERRPRTASITSLEEVTWRHALKIGCAQCLALVPGTSRAGATIVGGLLVGLSRKVATEFSFFLAVPTLFAAGGYQLFKDFALLSSADAGWFGAGFAAAFVSAFFCIRWLIRYVSAHDFIAFAWYRIAFGLVVLASAYSGLVNWTAR